VTTVYVLRRQESPVECGKVLAVLFDEQEANNLHERLGWSYHEVEAAPLVTGKSYEDLVKELLP